MTEAGENIISAMNDFSSLIASTMRETSPATATENGLGVPQSARKRQLPWTSRTVRTRSAAKAARKRLSPPTPQTTGTKRKSPHAAGAACKRLTTNQTAAQAVASPAPKRKSARAASAALTSTAVTRSISKRKPSGSTTTRKSPQSAPKDDQSGPKMRLKGPK